MVKFYVLLSAIMCCLKVYESADMSSVDERQSSTEDPLAFLRGQPQFQKMRDIVQQNPESLNGLLEQIGITNPSLLQLISQNKEAFVRMLNEPAQNAPSVPSNSTGEGDVGSDEATTNPTPGLQPGMIEVTPQDKDAIERLKALGFSEHLVVEAYFACEKNENLTANYLSLHKFDD